MIAVVYQKRLKKERRARKQIQDQLDLEIKRRTQLEDALKATGATPEQVRAITGNFRRHTFIFSTRSSSSKFSTLIGFAIAFENNFSRIKQPV